MNPAEQLAMALENAIRANSALDQASARTPGWIDVGIPLAEGPYPCVRIDGIQKSIGKTDEYEANVKVWSQDMSVSFFTLVEGVSTALLTCTNVLSEQYLHRPETGLNCALFPVTFYL